MKPHLGRMPLLLSIACAVAAPTSALAQEPPDADALFKRGAARMEAGNYEAACKDIAESRRLKPLPGTHFSLATCMDRWGRMATAVALYEEYLTIYDGLPDDRKAKQGERPKVAKERLQKLLPEVPRLTLTLPPNAPAGIVVKRDGQEVRAEDLGKASPVDPGEVVVTTQAPAEPVTEQRITIGKGEKKQVTLEVKLAPVVTPPPPVVQPPPTVQPSWPGAPPPSRTHQPPIAPVGMSGHRKAAFAIGGVGLAGLAVGAVTGGLTFGEKSTIEQHCGDAIGAPKARCDQTGLDAANRSRPLGLASSIAFAVGSVGLGVGLVLLVTDSLPATPKAGNARRWIAAEVVSVGPDGAMLGARGAF